MLLAVTLTEAAHAQDVVEKAADQIVPSLGAHALALLAEQDGRVRIVGHRGYSAEHLAELDGTPISADTAITHILHTSTPCSSATWASSWPPTRTRWSRTAWPPGRSCP